MLKVAAFVKKYFHLFPAWGAVIALSCKSSISTEVAGSKPKLLSQATAPSSVLATTTSIPSTGSTTVSTATSTSEAFTFSTPVLSADSKQVAWVASAAHIASNAAQVYVKNLATGTTIIASTTDGTTAGAGNSASSNPTFTPDGTAVIFASAASSLGANGNAQIFKKSLTNLSAAPVALSVTADGTTLANGASANPQVSADGTFVIFTTSAANLGVTNPAQSQIVKKSLTNLATAPIVISVATDGTTPGNGASTSAQISADGSFVLFASSASNLGATSSTQIIKKSLTNLATAPVVVSVATNGSTIGAGASSDPQISADGTFALFTTLAANLGANGGVNSQIIKKSLSNLATAPVVVSVTADGTTIGNGNSSSSKISSDGSFAIFTTIASNLGASASAAQIIKKSLSNLATAPVVMSVTADGSTVGNSTSDSGVISSDSSFVIFQSTALNLGSTTTAAQIIEKSVTNVATTPVVVGSSTLSGASATTLPAPSITSLSPSSGTTLGGDPITITGTSFASGATVTFAGVAPTSLTVVSSTTITCTTPSGSAGAVNVVITNTNGLSGTSTGGFTYVAPSAAFPITNGPILSSALSGTTLFLGGSFTRIGSYTGAGVPLDASTGSKPANVYWPGVKGSVYTVAADPNHSGAWYIGGVFTKVGANTRTNLAHINADGSLDLNWAPASPNAAVNAIVVNGDTVYIGGSFSSLGATTRNSFAAVDATSGSIKSLNPNLVGDIKTMTVSGGILYIGGTFVTVGGTARNRIASIDLSSGSLTSWNPNSDSYVSTIAVSGGVVYVGGGFANIGGSARNYIAALDPTTASATAWDPNANQSVQALAVAGSTVYAGGTFTSMGGSGRNYLAEIDKTTAAVTTWNPNGNGQIRGLVLSGTTLYVGGYFSSIGGSSRRHIAAFDTTTGNVSAWNPSANDMLNALAVSGSTVYAAGEFTLIGATARSMLASVDTTTGNVTAWDPTISGAGNVQVNTLVNVGSTLYVGGLFSSAGGSSRSNLAAIHTTTGAATSWQPDPSSDVYALAVNGTTLYVGGNFTTLSSTTRNYIAAFDTATGNLTSWNPNASNRVKGMAIAAGNVYAFGSFTTIGGGSRNGLASIDSSTGVATSWDPNPNNIVFSIFASGGIVYVGGQFSTIGGASRNNLAAIDATTGSATSWDPSPDGGVYSFAINGSALYIGGDFGHVGGPVRQKLASVDITTAAVNSWNPSSTGLGSATVYTIIVDSSLVYAAGSYANMGNTGRTNFIALDASGNPH